MSAITDPISDMLTRMRNALKAKHGKVDIQSSKMKESLAKILKDEGFIKNYKVIEDKKQNMLRVYLKYNADEECAINKLKKLSTPGRRRYISVGELHPIYNNMGIWILSTSKGIMTNKAAKQLNVGGELICEIF